MQIYKTPILLSGELKVVGGRLTQKQAAFVYGGLYLGMAIFFVLPIKWLGLLSLLVLPTLGYAASTYKMTRHQITLGDYVLLKIMYMIKPKIYVWARKGMNDAERS